MMETKIAVNYVKCRLEELGGRQLAGGASFQLEHITAIVAELDRLTALCDEYRGEIGRLLQEVAPAREIVQRGFKGAVGTIREAIEIEAYASALNKSEVNRLQSALTRARAEGMEEAAKTCDELANERFNGTYSDAAAAIRSAAKGEQ